MKAHTVRIKFGVSIIAFLLCLQACDFSLPENEYTQFLDVSDTREPVFAVSIVDIPTKADNDAISDVGKRFEFIGFGENLAWGEGQEPRYSPAIEYYTRSETAQVRAPCDLLFVKSMDNEEGVGDVELEFRLGERSAYFIYIDHVREVSIEEGEWIEEGQVLGFSGVATEFRSELQINFIERIESGGYRTTHLCPLDFGTAAFLEAHSNLASLSDWKLAESLDGGTFGVE